MSRWRTSHRSGILLSRVNVSPFGLLQYTLKTKNFLVSIYIYIYIYITFRRKTTSQRSDFKFHVYTIIRLQILHLHSNSFKDHSNTLGERAILSSTKDICSCVCI